MSTDNEFWKDLGWFVSITSMHDGLIGFLKQVGILIKFFTLYSLDFSLTLEFKSPVIKMCLLVAAVKSRPG